MDGFARALYRSIYMLNVDCQISPPSFCVVAHLDLCELTESSPAEQPPFLFCEAVSDSTEIHLVTVLQ